MQTASIATSTIPEDRSVTTRLQGNPKLPKPLASMSYTATSTTATQAQPPSSSYSQNQNQNQNQQREQYHQQQREQYQQYQQNQQSRRNVVTSMATSSAAQTIPPPAPTPVIHDGPPSGVSLYEWYSRPRPGAFRLYSSGNVDLEDVGATAPEVAPASVKPDMPTWNGKLESLDLFHGSLNMFFGINKPHITRYQAIYLTIQALPLSFQLEVANLHFMQYYEIIFILQESYNRIQLSKLRCRSPSIEDVLDYLSEHVRLYKTVDSIAGIDAQEMLHEGMPAPYKPPVKPKPVTKREHLQEVELMAYHLRFKLDQTSGASVTTVADTSAT